MLWSLQHPRKGFACDLHLLQRLPMDLRQKQRNPGELSDIGSGWFTVCGESILDLYIIILHLSVFSSDENFYIFLCFEFGFVIVC